LPMVVCQTLSSTAAGIVVTRTGKWKPTMLVGSILMLLGMVGLGLIDYDSSYLWVSASMAVTGIGVGALIQNIVLAVQNTVDVADIGAVSATIAFFRSLGGAIGVTALGAVLTSQVAAQIQQDTAELSGSSEALDDMSGNNTSLDLSGLPESDQQLIHQAYAYGFGVVFLISTIISVLALLAIILVRERPLR